MASIPISEIVSVQPAVIDAGGSGLDLVGLFLTDNAQAPVGSVLSFATAADVSAYFGALSTEATLATTYFAGYTGSSIKPANMLFHRYATANVASYLRGGDVSGLTLEELQALTGVLTISVDGSNKTSSSISLSAATSFSNAATIIADAFTSPGFVVSYDSISGGFVFTNSTTGVASTIGFATGTLSAGLKLTSVTGAVTSQGADEAVPGPSMGTVVAATQNFVSFSTTFEPDDADKLLFAAWAGAQNSRYLYIGWDDNSAATVNGDTTSFGSQVRDNAIGGVAPVYDPSNGATVAAFVAGAIASIDFTAQNGRATLAFRRGSVNPGVTNATIANNLTANGYNYVGRYAGPQDVHVILMPGQCSGDFDWIDSYICQVWMNNSFQASLMNLLVSVGSIPYNAEGYALIEASLRSVIDNALFFGAIRAGVPLSAEQIAEVNASAGGDVAGSLEQQGWYIKVAPASAEVRAARGSPPIKVFYTDGQSVQQINLTSINVQ